jgi:hypothetical protein
MEKSCLNRLDVQLEDVIWIQIAGNDPVEENIIERDVEQFSHTGATP